MKQLVTHLSILLSVCVVVLLTNLGGSRLWDRDEPRNAGCALEMIEGGDWIVPKFNGELRTAKPVLLYWLIMSAYAVLGVNEFAARFWSAALGIGTVLATYGIGRRLLNPQAAFWGALALCTCLMYGVASRAAVPDSPLIFFSTMALLVYVLGAFSEKSESELGGPDKILGAAPVRTSAGSQIKFEYFPVSWPVVAIMYALMGVAVLAKGPVGLVLPTAVIGLFLIIVRLPAERDADRDQLQSRYDRFVSLVGFARRAFGPKHFLQTCLTMRPITALAIAMAVSLPWYVWVGIRTDGQWLRAFFLEEHLGRATKAMENHDGPLWYYPVTIGAGFFPWSLLMVPTVIDATSRMRRREPCEKGYLFLACWVAVYVGLFSLAQTKLPSCDTSGRTPLFSG